MIWVLHDTVALDTRAVETLAELAELAKLTPARVTQIMNLLGLSPDIQEEIFFLPPVTEGQPPVAERHLQQVLKTLVWSEQRERWAAIRPVHPRKWSRKRWLSAISALSSRSRNRGIFDLDTLLRSFDALPHRGALHTR